jgi:hypothetical protein
MITAVLPQEWRAHDNGDLSGEVILSKDGVGEVAVVPFEALDNLVIKYLQQRKIEQLEQMTSQEVADAIMKESW